jgi:hypothetical protein
VRSGTVRGGTVLALLLPAKLMTKLQRHTNARILSENVVSSRMKRKLKLANCVGSPETSASRRLTLNRVPSRRLSSPRSPPCRRSRPFCPSSGTKPRNHAFTRAVHGFIGVQRVGAVAGDDAGRREFVFHGLATSDNGATTLIAPPRASRAEKRTPGAPQDCRGIRAGTPNARGIAETKIQAFRVSPNLPKTKIRALRMPRHLRETKIQALRMPPTLPTTNCPALRVPWQPAPLARHAPRAQTPTPCPTLTPSASHATTAYRAAATQPCQTASPLASNAHSPPLVCR